MYKLLYLLDLILIKTTEFKVTINEIFYVHKDNISNVYYCISNL